MLKHKYRWLVFACFLCCLINQAVMANTLHIVAAENVYGYIAKQLGGKYVEVTNILQNPKQDPHLFSASPVTAKAIAQADIIIYNGAGYDPWIEKLMNVAPKNKINVINMAELLHYQNGGNPHLWYDPNMMPIYTKNLVNLLIQQDAIHKKDYTAQLENFLMEYQHYLNRIHQFQQRYHATPITATEPIFNYLAQALGLTMYGEDFQLSVMNDISPTPKQMREFEQYLRNHQVRVLIYNKQVSNPLTERMQTLAQQVGIQTVGMSEMQPHHKTYIQWMQMQLTELEQAINARH